MNFENKKNTSTRICDDFIISKYAWQWWLSQHPHCSCCLGHVAAHNIQALSRLFEADVIPPPLQQQLETPPPPKGPQCGTFLNWQVTEAVLWWKTSQRWPTTTVNPAEADFCSSVSPSGLNEDLSCWLGPSRNRQLLPKASQDCSEHVIHDDFIPAIRGEVCWAHTAGGEDDPGEAGSGLQSGAPRCSSSYTYDTFMFSANNRKYLFRGNISHHMNTLDSFLLFRQPK